MQNKEIIIKGARVNNLKNIDISIPRDKFIVITGLSGSGKSSLAFDTIYADGQRRYVESLSSYARMFLGQMEKPDVDSIEGLSPAISIDQKTTSKNPRSTVGTVTEIYDYLRLLFARIGTPHCPICGREIRQQTIDEMVDRILALPINTKIILLAPIVRERKGEHLKEFENAKKAGYVRVRVDGILYDLTENIRLDKNTKHTIEIVVDRLIIKPEIKSRLADSLETVCKLSNGLALIDVVDGEPLLFSQNYSCPEHDISIEEISPRLFSFNNPYGACPTCSGLGYMLEVDPVLVMCRPDLSIRDDAFKSASWSYQEEGIAKLYFDELSKKYDIDLDCPVGKLPKDKLDIILFGNHGEKLKLKRESESWSRTYESEFEGIVNNLKRRYRETTSEAVRYSISQFMSESTCQTCEGKRLNKTALAVTVQGKSIIDFCNDSIIDNLGFFKNLELTPIQNKIAEPIIKEINSRLNFLINVGLGYLTLSRSSATLSGGESQRIRLATQIGSSLVGVLYILDEPSIGLHQRDNEKLIETLKDLRDQGNTVIVVEHDEETMLASDFIVDVGPGAGIHGGNIIYAGPSKDIINCKESITGQYLSGNKKIEIPNIRRKGNGKTLTIHGACENNLKNIDVSFPLGTFIAVTGVSGSGKSSLINEVLFKALYAQIMNSKIRPGKYKSIEGVEFIDKVINIDQSPIGRTPRSNPATYTGVFNAIRDLFESLPVSKMRGYKAGRFSFNTKGGRCEACQGDGIIKIEMHFLPDVYVPCDVCKGKRYNRETLEVKYKGKSIYDILEMTVEEGIEFFENHSNIQRKLQTLFDVGLGYMKIGQSSTTLSGGEAQRVKLATELSKIETGKTLYILDEPTTGLHSEDVRRLIDVLQKLVNAGNTVLVIEHNMDVIKSSDFIVDLGPEGGTDGGTIVCTGTPEEVANCSQSYTGQFLKKYLLCH